MCCSLPCVNQLIGVENMAYKSLAIRSLAVVLCFFGSVQYSGSAVAATILGSAESFAVLAGSAVTNTGASTIVGDVGGTTGISGLGSASLTGTTHLNDAASQAALIDAAAAYTYLHSLPSTTNLTGQDLGGLTLTSGVYSYNSSAQLTGTLTLDFAGLSNQLIVVNMGSTLTTASGSSVVAINANPTDKVYFVAGSSATLGSGTELLGSVLADISVTMNSGASIVYGNAIGLSGAVTMINNTVKVSDVPLPAALPLFGTAIAGLVGLGKRRKAAKNDANLVASPSA